MSERIAEEDSPQVDIRSVVEEEDGAVAVAVPDGVVEESEPVRVDHVDARPSFNNNFTAHWVITWGV